MIKEYIHTGRCIWCGKTKPEVTFKSEPHIIPEAFGGEEIGVDVCDQCNSYFGTATAGVPNMDLVFKEIFNATKFSMSERNANSWKNFKTVFFRYEHKRSTFVIKNNFREHIITRQFKRSLFEVFLQAYHKETHDGNNPKFIAVREFARYNRGDLRVFYVFNNIVFTEDRNAPPVLHFSQSNIEKMHETGLFSFLLHGHMFYLEVFPIAFNANGVRYLREEASKVLINVKGNERITELKSIYQMDFFMTRFNNK